MGEFLKANSVAISSILAFLVMLSAAMVGSFWRNSRRRALYFGVCTLILSAVLFWVAYEDMVRQQAEFLALCFYVVLTFGGFAYGFAPARKSKEAAESTKLHTPRDMSPKKEEAKDWDAFCDEAASHIRSVILDKKKPLDDAIQFFENQSAISDPVLREKVINVLFEIGGSPGMAREMLGLFERRATQEELARWFDS